MTRSKFAFAILVVAVISGCAELPLNENEPHFGSECVVFEKAEERMPIIFEFNHDLGESPGSSRLTMDVEVQAEPLQLGDAKLESHTKYQFVIFDPFELEGSQRIIVRHTGTGDVQTIEDYEPYGSDTAPAYKGVNVMLDEDPEGAGAWLHIEIGDSAEHGLRIHLQYV